MRVYHVRTYICSGIWHGTLTDTDIFDTFTLTA